MTSKKQEGIHIVFFDTTLFFENIYRNQRLPKQLYNNHQQTYINYEYTITHNLFLYARHLWAKQIEL